MQQADPIEVKADALLGAHQRGLAKPAAEASEVARKFGGNRLEKRTILLTNTDLRDLAVENHPQIKYSYRV